MVDNVQLNPATATTGATIAGDDIGGIIHQRVKIVLGSDGASEGDISSNNKLPVLSYLQAGTATIGFIGISAGTATIGSVNLSTGGAVSLKTATGGIIPSDTASGLMVKFGTAQSVNVSGTVNIQTATTLNTQIQAGTATIGTVILSAGNTIGISGGIATIGTVNLASGGAISLQTSTGGVIPADTASGLMVKFGSAQDVNFATGSAMFLKTSTGGILPADTTSGLTVKFGQTQSVSVSGAVSIQTATTLNTQLQAGTATVGTVVLSAGNTVGVSGGTATIGTVLVGAGTATIGTVLNQIQPSVATDSRGPKVTNVTTSGTTALATAPGTGNSIYVTSIAASNAGSAAQRLSIQDGSTTRYRMSLASGGGGFVQTFDPAWQLTSQTALNASVTAAGDLEINAMFYVAAK